MTEEGEELNPKLGELIKTLTGVDLTDANGEFRSTYDILVEIGEQFDKLGSKEQALLLEEIAGKNQANTLSAIFKNLQQIPKAYETLQDSAGSAAKEQEAYVESLSGKINSLQQNISGIWNDLVNRGAVGSGIDMLNGVVSAVRNVMDAFGSLNSIVGAVAFGFAAFTEKGRSMISSIVEMTPGLHRVNNLFDDMTKKLNKKAKVVANDVAITKGLISANKASGESFAGLSLKLVGYNAKLAATKVGILAVKAASVALNAALTGVLSMAVSFGVSKLAEFVDGLYTTKAELREMNEEFRSVNESSVSLSELVSEYKELANTMKNTSSISSEYSEAEKRIKSVEDQLIEAYPQLNDLLKQNTKAKWENVEAIQEMTDKELEAAKAQAWVSLDNNKVNNYSDVAEDIAKYQELIDKRREYTDLLSQGKKKTIGSNVEIGDKALDVSDELERTNKAIDEYEKKLQTVYMALQLVGEENGFKGSLSSLKEVLGITTEAMKETREATDNLGSGFGNAAVDAEVLKNSINGISNNLSLLNTMIEEFEEYGNLTQDTYLKVLTSGEEELIALLADSDKFLERAYEKRKQYLDSLGEDAKNLIGSSYANQYGDNTYIDEDSLKYTFENITDMANSMANEINDSIANINVDTLGDNLKDVFSDIITESDVLSENLQNGIKEYVLSSINAAEQSAEAIVSAEEAKQEASAMWKNAEIVGLAEMVGANASQYEADVVNWANAVLSKDAENIAWSDNVYKFVSDMVAYSNGAYSDDVTNWAIAVGNKDLRNVQMVNSVMSSIAKMILANQQNYSADTVAWANAINNKIANNSAMCNTVSQKMADAINNMIDNYGADVNQFRQAIVEKARMYDIFQTNVISAEKNNNTKTTTYTVHTNKAWKEEQQKVLDKIVNEVSSNYQSRPVTGINVGSSGVGSVENPDTSKDKGTAKEVSDMEDVVDRYYALNNALKKVENAISDVETELETKTGKDRIALIEKEIKLLNDKRNALINIRNEQQNELMELRNSLAMSGFGFDADGQISNYTSNLSRLVANANSLTGEAKENAIKNVQGIVKQLEQYTSLLLTDIPDITNQINGITGSVSDLREEIDQIIEDTTFFTKDFIDRYYELNNALKQVENQLNAISTAMKNADDNKLVELLDKQIELYIKQGEALAALKKENVAELNELGKELYNAGFVFNSDGTLSNYQQQIDKMVQAANNITDGKKQEKEIERINSLIESIEKYTDLLLNDIPNIKNDMDDLANSVIDSQKEIANVLSKQKDEYIDNLKKETEALKQEVERRKEILQKQWEQEDTADELAEKQQKLNELEDQLTLALRTGDEELIKNIREQITAAQKEINDFIRDEERDYISDRFNEDLDKLDEDLNNKIDKINEKLSDKELLNLVQSGVRDLTEVLNNIENGSKGVRSAFAAIGTTISETWINALDTFVDKLNSISDINLGFNVGSKLGDVMKGFNREVNITQGNLIVQGNITEDILPMVQGMIDTANNNLIRDINAAFSR